MICDNHHLTANAVVQTTVPGIIFHLVHMHMHLRMRKRMRTTIQMQVNCRLHFTSVQSPEPNKHLCSAYTQAHTKRLCASICRQETNIPHATYVVLTVSLLPTVSREQGHKPQTDLTFQARNHIRLQVGVTCMNISHDAFLVHEGKYATKHNTWHQQHGATFIPTN